ncbi:polar amino acid ABC transporter, inner membrane subunit [Desulfovibrio sp. X2]|uniref:amino acid ABC transporter permease n=1 Tax=Desulfovibrio sp. X2 TaxID=941449 RepID=UPI00035881BB|nr:amino acid ABC transporter permease [Desulfovibrio sp. X2]EPR44794.1 polar amino acid ABC transporter, inner membrane subunit [Desulfovibrio sp. X2]
MAPPASSVRPARLDAVLLPALAALAGLGLWQLGRGLDYQWHWGVVWHSFLRYDPHKGWVVNLLTQGLLATLRLSAWSMVLALAAGTAAGIASATGRLFWRMWARSYVELVRNLPPLVLVFLFYFFIGDQIMTWLGVDELMRSLPRGAAGVLSVVAAPPDRFASFLSAVLTLALYEGAYIAEIVRAGIESVPRGQWEAAYALGLSPWQRLRRVVLPQALRSVVPALAGQFISTVKDSAIVSVISVPELTFEAMEIMATTYRTYEIWLTVLGVYLVLCLGLSWASRRVETALARRGAAAA